MTVVSLALRSLVRPLHLAGKADEVFGRILHHRHFRILVNGHLQSAHLGLRLGKHLPDKARVFVSHDDVLSLISRLSPFRMLYIRHTVEWLIMCLCVRKLD